jgi:ABC-2 type transport system ATP-binding protein
MSIIVENLAKQYGEQWAVDQISFQIQPGEIVGFLGPNGAGKSTTMKILAGFIPQTAGKAQVAGYDVESQAIESRRRTGYLPEHNPLYLDLYVKEYLLFVAKLHQVGRRHQRVRDMIGRTGLEKESHKKIRQLSKGYRQRVGLAQALIHEPEVLILDEPTSGLDPNQLVDIRALISEIGKEKTVMMSTHIMQEVQAICDRIIIINGGKLVADDQTQQVQKSREPETRMLVGFKEDISEDLLSKMENVRSVSKQADGKWLIHFNKGAANAAEVVFRFAVDNRLTLLSSEEKSQSLEDTFRELTGNQKAEE